MSWLITSQPLHAILILPIFVSLHITKLTLIKIISVSSIIFYSLAQILVFNNDFIELWALCIYLFFFLIFKAKNLQISDIESSEKIIADEEFIYHRDFKNEFNYDEFCNIFLKDCEIKKCENKNKVFMTEGEPFEKIYYFIKIPTTTYVTIKHQKIIISYLKESSWIGVVEFLQEFFDTSQKKWLIGLDVDNPNQEEIIWMEWNKKVSK
jgi:hypothetical protein